MNRVLTAVEARKLAIEAKEIDLANILVNIEEAAKQGEVKYKIANNLLSEIVIQELKSLGYKISGIVQNGHGGAMQKGVLTESRLIEW